MVTSLSPFDIQEKEQERELVVIRVVTSSTSFDVVTYSTSFDIQVMPQGMEVVLEQEV